MRKILLFLNIACLVLTLLAYAAPYISPAQMPLMLFMGLLYPWLLLAHLIFCLIWGLSRMRYFWLSALTVLAGYSYLTSFVGVKAVFQPTPSVSGLKVMTYNISAASLPRLKDKINGTRAFNTALEAENPDIFCVQECRGELGKKDLFSRLPFLATYPYTAQSEANSVCIFSKFPIDTQGVLIQSPANGDNGCTWADIAWQGRVLRVYAVHLKSNSVSGMAGRAEITEVESWSTILNMLSRVRKYGIQRAKQAEEIARNMAICPHPMVVCGDFNDTPVSYNYHLLSKNLQDAFQERGYGLGTTYAGRIPALKIDNILVDERFVVGACAVQKWPFSDHYPLVAQINWR